MVTIRLYLGSASGAVCRAVDSNSSSNFKCYQLYQNWIEKKKIKEKEAGKGPIF